MGYFQFLSFNNHYDYIYVKYLPVVFAEVLISSSIILKWRKSL